MGRRAVAQPAIELGRILELLAAQARHRELDGAEELLTSALEAATSQSAVPWTRLAETALASLVDSSS